MGAPTSRSTRAGRWRILVGDDARQLDEPVRADPENIYSRTDLPIERPAVR